MVDDDDIIIEDRYGAGRNINDIPDHHVSFENKEVNIVSDIKKDENLEKNNDSNEESLDEDGDKVIVNNLSQSSEIKHEINIKNQILEVISKPKKQFSFKWYPKISIIGIFSIIFFNIIAIILKNNPNTQFLYSFRSVFEMLVFLVLSFLIIRNKKQFPKISGINCAYTGFFSGIFVSLFRLFYEMKLWTIFNLATETIFLSLEGFIAGLVFGALFYGTEESLKNSINT